MTAEKLVNKLKPKEMPSLTDESMEPVLAKKVPTLAEKIIAGKDATN